MNTHRIVVAVLTLAAASSLGAGFRLETHGARASGMAGAVSALIDDASGIYYNPAGIVGRKGLDASLGVTLVIPSIAFQSDNTGMATSALTKLSTPVNFYASYGITEDLAVGLGIFTPFGAGAQWPDTWEGAGRALTSSVQTFDFNPTIAWRIHPRFKIAAGFQAIRGTVLIERGLNFIDSAGKVTLGGDAWGFGWNAGFQLDVWENKVWIGATWRSATTMNFEGRAHFSDIPLEFQARLADQPIKSKVILPDVATFGVGVRPTDKLRVGLDVNATTWGSFRELLISFENPDLTNPLPKHWVDSASVHLGAEYDVTTAISARLGFAFDPTVSPANTLTPDLPDATRVRITAGAGWRSTFGLSVDLAYQFVLLTPATSTAPGFSGTYTGSAQVIALNVGYRL